MSAVLIILVAFLCVAYALGDESCNTRRVLECEQPLITIFGATPLVTDEVLTNNCSDIKTNLQCIEDYLEECNDEGFESFTNYFASPKVLLYELCIPNSPVRIAYRQHVTCLRRVDLRNITDELDVCFENLGESTMEELRALEDDMTALRCAIYEPVKNCLKGMASRYCGNTAGLLVELLIASATQMPRYKFCEINMLLDLEELDDEFVDFMKKK